MFGIELTEFSLWVNIAFFSVMAAIVWFTGTRLAEFSDVIAERTGIGQAFAGLILLAGATSLPELATTLTAAIYGNAPLAAGNLLGGVAMQTAIIAIADIVAVKGALTIFALRATLLLEGALLILMLVVTIIGATIGDFPVFGVGLWTSLIFGIYLLALFLLKNYEKRESWRPVDIPNPDDDGRISEEDEVTALSEVKELKELKNASTKRVAVYYAIAAVVVLVSGFTLTRVVEAIGSQTGIAATFAGATLLAISTSLPELSTTITAVKLGASGMAISNVFGSNAADTALLFVADVAHQGEPVLSTVGTPAVFLAGIGVALTTVYLIGLIERYDKSFLRAGIDSMTVLVVYAASMVVLYFLT